MSEFPSIQADELVTKEFLARQLAEALQRQTRCGVPGATSRGARGIAASLCGRRLQRRRPHEEPGYCRVRSGHRGALVPHAVGRAGARKVWAVVSTMDGVNAELRPLMRMTHPAHLQSFADVDSELGPGRACSTAGCWCSAFAGRSPRPRHRGGTTGEGFDEESSSWFQRRWRHERRVIDGATGPARSPTTSPPRLGVLAPVIRWVVTRRSGIVTAGSQPVAAVVMERRPHVARAVVIAPRCAPAIAALPRARQWADHLAWGALVGVTL